MGVTRSWMLHKLGLAAASARLVVSAAQAADTDPRDATRPPSPASTPNPHLRSNLYRKALVWDNHSGFDPRPGYDLEHLEEWRKAGIDYLSINVGYDVIDWQLAIKNLGSYITWLENRPERFVLARHTDDILRAKAAGKMAITFDLEGMSALAGETYMVSLYYRLGVRQMLIAYNRNNLAGGGCHDDDHGLTDFGRSVIAEMNRVGMIVDCSHTGLRTTMEVMQMATQPVVFSHSNPKALRVHGRNITDEQIRACARTGGVVGINGIGLFLPDHDATTKSIIDCIVYVKDLVGVDHVGIGLDYSPASVEEQLDEHPEYWPRSEYADQEPTQVAGPDRFPLIATALLERGWSETDTIKVMGGNFLRVAHAVWK
jgi:membrane dipeptidase